MIPFFATVTTAANAVACTAETINVVRATYKTCAEDVRNYLQLGRASDNIAPQVYALEASLWGGQTQIQQEFEQICYQLGNLFNEGDRTGNVALQEQSREIIKLKDQLQRFLDLNSDRQDPAASYDVIDIPDAVSYDDVSNLPELDRDVELIRRPSQSVKQIKIFIKLSDAHQKKVIKILYDQSRRLEVHMERQALHSAQARLASPSQSPYASDRRAYTAELDGQDQERTQAACRRFSQIARSPTRDSESQHLNRQTAFRQAQVSQMSSTGEIEWEYSYLSGQDSVTPLPSYLGDQRGSRRSISRQRSVTDQMRGQSWKYDRVFQ